MFHTNFDENTLTWSGLQKVPTYNSNVTVGQVVLEALQRNPKKIGQVLDVGCYDTFIIPHISLIKNNLLSNQKLFITLTFIQINANNGIELTNDEIRIKSIRVAQNLQNLGFNKNHIFSFAASNNHHIASVVFGTLAIGAGVSTLDPSYTKSLKIYSI